MVITINRAKDRITVARMHQGVDDWMAMLTRVLDAPFWRSKQLVVKVNYERQVVELKIAATEVFRNIPFTDMVRMTRNELVEHHMRPLASMLADHWGLTEAAHVVLEQTADADRIREAVRFDDQANANSTSAALCNLAFPEDWDRRLLIAVEFIKQAVREPDHVSGAVTYHDLYRRYINDVPFADAEVFDEALAYDPKSDNSSGPYFEIDGEGPDRIIRISSSYST